MKKGLVLEGGAMRGLFTAGVIDVFMENNIPFDGAIGTSAGAGFGCNYKSRQIGRVLRYNKKYCMDKRYASVRSWLKTGDLYGADFVYRDLPDNLDPFDVKTFAENEMEFYVTCTDVVTGEAVYHRCDKGDARDILWMRASASMPIAAKIVNIDGQLLLDGGMADSISLRHFIKLGYDRNVVVLTQPFGYVKKRNKLMPLLRIVYRKYPNFIKALETRHERYNETLGYIKRLEKEGDVFVIRPPKALEIGTMEKDPAQLQRVYDIGRETATAVLDDVKKFLGI